MENKTIKTYKNYTIEKITDLELITLDNLVNDLKNTCDANIENIVDIYEEYIEKVQPKRQILKVVKSEINVDLKEMFQDIYNNVSLSGIICEFIRTFKNSSNDYINEYLKQIKGVADNQTNTTKVIKFVNSFRNLQDNTLIDRVINYVNLNYSTSDVYYLYSNDLFDILTASYSQNIRSCYNINGGDYNNSLTYIINDNITNNCKWYVLKEIKDVSTIETLNDPTQLYYLTLNRRFLTTDNNNTIQLLGTNYGIDKRICSADLKYIMWLYNHDSIENVVENENKFDYYAYSSDYINAYVDYNRNECNTLSIENTDNFIDLWRNDIEVINPVSAKGEPLRCANCGEIIDDHDDAVYIDGEYYCRECTYYCECCDNYFVSGNGIEINGYYYCDNCIHHV